MTATHRCDPRVCPQLRPRIPTAGEDCGVRTTQRAIRWASCGKVFATVKEIRHWMGKPSGPTNPPDWLKVMRHPDLIRRFAKAGLQPPEVHLRGVTKLGFIVGSPIKTAVTALGDGKLLCVAESYLPWHNTQWAGSATFIGNHAVSYEDIEGAVGERTSNRYDSIADGRAPGIAKGPDKVPWNKAVTAMELLDLDAGPARRPLGTNKWAGMVVERALAIEKPPAPPTCEEQLAALQAAYDALLAADDDDGDPSDSTVPVAEGVTATAAGPADVEDVS